MAAPSWFRIGSVLVQPDRLVLIDEGKETKLEPRQMQVLIMLVEHAAKIVSTEQMLIEIWRGTFYGDNPVQKAVSQLRTALKDDARAPRYIETIPKRGYRLIANVAFPEGYRSSGMGGAPWTGRSPYVGLAAFDSEHSAVFCGRSRVTADLLRAMRAQIDQQRRFVLIVGASGCGKSSLLHSGAIPELRKPGGFDGLQALAEAHCDLAAAQGGDALRLLATALSAWTLSERSVFAPGPVDELTTILCERPKSIASTIEEALRRHADRKLAEQPHAHLLLTVDHSEALVASSRIEEHERNAFWRAIETLCDSPRVLVVMLVRSDFYPKLIQALPELADRKSGDGHLDVLAPQEGEITQMIRNPAAKAGLNFEEDDATGQRLDDVLRDTAIRQPDTLPLLQHTLLALYERRSGATMTFAAYREIGGLEGAIAHRAEETFADLPVTAQASLDRILSLLTIVELDNESLSARHSLNTSLPDDNARILVDAFIKARLFVGDHDDGQPRFGVAHEALLRQWPRARDWAQDNRRLLQSRARLIKAAERWIEVGRDPDHLLNPGRPLAEALELIRLSDNDVGENGIALVTASKQQLDRKKRIRTCAVLTLAALSITSTAMAIITLQARNEADHRRVQAQEYAMVLFDAADKLQKTGDTKILGEIGDETLASLSNQSSDHSHYEDLVIHSRAPNLKGSVLLSRGAKSEAETAFLQAKEKSIIAYALSPDSDVAILQAGHSAFWLGNYYFLEGDYKRTEDQWEDYFKYCNMLLKIDNKNRDWLIETSFALDNLGTLAERQMKIKESISYLQKSIKLKKEALEIDSTDTSLIFEKIVTESKISNALASIGELSAADEGYSTQIIDLRELVEPNSSAHEWTQQLASLLHLRASLAVMRGNTSDALSYISESIELLSGLVRTNREHISWKKQLAKAHFEASDINRMIGDQKSVKKHLDDAEVIIDSLAENEKKDQLWRRIEYSVEFSIALQQQSSHRMHMAISRLHKLFIDSRGDIYIMLALCRTLTLAAKFHASLGQTEKKRELLHLADTTMTDAAASSQDPRIIGPLTYIRNASKHPPINSKNPWLAKIGYLHPDYSGDSNLTALRNK
jgi:DNA-binding winged helix-turn-helix (wHTH) protein/tetratricopeptide (TPR) repeat protein